MGVPVLSLLGDSMPGRMSASFLRAMNLNDWIAESEDAFVKLGRRHAERVRTFSTEQRSAAGRCFWIPQWRQAHSAMQTDSPTRSTGPGVSVDA